MSTTIPGHLTFARRCKGQLPPIFPDCLEATLCRSPFRVMSLLHGGARGNYRQFFRTVLKALFVDYHSGSCHYCMAVQRAAIAIFSECLEATSLRFHPGSSHFCTAAQGATTANFSKLFRRHSLTITSPGHVVIARRCKGQL